MHPHSGQKVGRVGISLTPFTAIGVKADGAMAFATLAALSGRSNPIAKGAVVEIEVFEDCHDISFLSL